MPSRVAGLTRGTIVTAPSVCRECVWWQSRGNKTASKERWIEKVEEESGEWGTIYYDDDGSVLGSMHKGQRSLREWSDDMTSLHVSVGPGNNFDAHVDKVTPTNKPYKQDHCKQQRSDSIMNDSFHVLFFISSFKS